MREKLILPPILSDGMVVQQNQPICFWGWDEPGTAIKVSFDSNVLTTLSDSEGKWCVEFAAYPAGGPFEATIIGSEIKTLQDIYVGEVWLASGQSNMELQLDRTRDLFEEEISKLNFPLIREFFVPIEYDFEGPRDMPVEKGEWRKTTIENAPILSAVSSFFAQKLYQELNIPIGIIMTAVGGSPIEAWLPEEELKDKPEIREKLTKLREPGWVQNVQAEDERRTQEWYRNVEMLEKKLDPSDHWTEPGFDDAQWDFVSVPGMLADTAVGGSAGSIWFRHAFEVADADIFDEHTLLKLGAMIDYDEVWLNGVPVGKTEYRYPPRRYTLPKGILQTGENVLAVKLIINGTNGGFIGGPGKYFGLENKNRKLDLAGTWKAKRVTTVDPSIQMTFFQYKPTGLYNAMLHPLKNYPVAGFIFYQGESNTGNPQEYGKLKKRMIERWRRDWQNHDLPFLYVQLTNYLDALAESDDRQWAELRHQQATVEKQVPHVAMTVSIDVGEGNDLHPLDKKTVGERLAEDALEMVYQKKIGRIKPELVDITTHPNEVIVAFDSEINQKTENTYLEMKDADNQWKITPATVRGNKIVIPYKDGEKITGVRYAFLNNPEKPAFTSMTGYPVGPFQVDVPREISSNESKTP